MRNETDNDATAPEQWPLHDKKVKHTRGGGCRAEEEIPLKVSSSRCSELHSSQARTLLMYELILCVCAAA